MLDPLDLAAALAAPFGPQAIRFRPGATNGTRALVLPYLTAAAVCDRLDAVLGVAGWRDTYHVLDGGCVQCVLSVLINGAWISKEDVGSPSEQPDAGDRMKSAFSDSLKRAAVKWGIGRYLSRLAPLWADYDPAKKRFTKTPTLPAPARPMTPAVAAAARLRGSQLAPVA